MKLLPAAKGRPTLQTAFWVFGLKNFSLLKDRFLSLSVSQATF